SANGKLKMPHFEFMFRLEIKDVAKTNLFRYLPLTPLRVLLDATATDQTKSIPKAKLDAVVVDVSDEKKKEVSNLPKDAFAQILKKAQTLATTRAQKYKEEAKEKFTHEITREINRLQKLKKHNPLISEDEILHLQEYLSFGVERIETTE